jgi:hypothetical protein
VCEDVPAEEFDEIFKELEDEDELLELLLDKPKRSSNDTYDDEEA